MQRNYGRWLLFALCIVFIMQTLYFKNQIEQSEQQVKNEMHYFFVQLQKNIDDKKSEIVVQTKASVLNEIDKKKLQTVNNKMVNLATINNKISFLEETLSTIEGDIKQLPTAELVKTIKLSKKAKIVEQKIAQSIKDKAENKTTITKNKTEITKQTNKTETKQEFAQEKAIKKLISYKSHNSETLWSIAKKFYGKGIYYPVILEMNPGLTLNNHKAYGAIKLFKRQAAMLDVYWKIKTASKKSTPVPL